MLLKILLLITVVGVIYFLYFKKSGKVGHNDTKNSQSDDMVACDACGTYTSVSDALIKGGKYYCSRECMEG